MRDRVRPAHSRSCRSLLLAAGVLALPLAAPLRAAAQGLATPPAQQQPGPAPAPAPTPTPGPAAATPPLSPSQGASIVAVVNGDVISMGDVDARRRLFAVSTGLPLNPAVLDRLTQQVIRQLIDEKLRLQEIQRRQIVVDDSQIAAAIGEIEKRNGMAPGTLQRRLAADGVNMRTMIDQTRVQLGWGMVLRQVLGAQAQVTDADIADLERTLKAQTGQEEYRVGEIFVPITDPNQAADAQRFADTIIQQLRAGAPFSVVAAQFSQSQTALLGGDLGWVQGNQVSDEELRILREMPVGAISNPVRVPGGLSIITLRGKRQVGNETALMATVRQVFFPFTSKLDPNNPTAQQRQAVEHARTLVGAASTCEALDAAAAKMPDAKKVDPGEIRVDSITTPVLRQMVATLPVGKPSQPLIADDGAAVVMVCSRETKSLGLPPKKELADRILSERVELASRQLLRDLQRRATIDLRS